MLNDFSSSQSCLVLFKLKTKWFLNEDIHKSGVLEMKRSNNWRWPEEESVKKTIEAFKTLFNVTLWDPNKRKYYSKL